MAYKYPYIPDKTVYAAVMYAAKIVRETGYFNKAVRMAAEWYSVDEDVVAKYLQERSSAGRRAKGTNKGVKYQYYVVETWVETDADPEGHITDVAVRRATSKEKAERDHEDENRRADYGGSYAPFWIDRVRFSGTKTECEDFIAKHYRKKVRE